MLEQISWTNFGICLLGGCIAYYGLLLVTGRMAFKRNREVSAKTFTPAGLTKRKWEVEEQETEEQEHNSSQAAIEEKTASIPGRVKEDQSFSALELLADELQVLIMQCGTENTSKEELLLTICKEIARYPTLNKPVFRNAINNLVIQSALQECGIDVSKQEANDLWTNL